MIRVLQMAVVSLCMVGCVTTGTFQKEKTRADDAQKEIAKQQTELNAAKKALEAEKTTEQDLTRQLKADAAQIASIQKANSELAQKFATNWELSTARATAVARYLQENTSTDPKRLIATGYGEFRPVSSNDTPDTRAANRRIEIVLVARE